jgi:hypothetical protein
MESVKDFAPFLMVMLCIGAGWLHFERRLTRLEALRESDQDQPKRKIRGR